MKNLFKAPINKEAFKMAMNECGKKAWIFNSLDNFKSTLKMKQNNSFAFYVETELENEEEFSSDASNIDIFELYLSDKENQLDFWNETDGFQISKFAGDSIEDGNAFGALARDYFTIKNQEDSNRNKTNYEVYDFEQYTFSNALQETKELLNNKNHNYRYLFEAAFEYDNHNLKTRCDVLELKEDNHVNIIEVKATGTVKKEHFFDLMYQAYILEKNGFIVDDVFIGRVDSNYVYGQDNIYDDLKAEIKEFISENSDISFKEVQDFLKKLPDQPIASVLTNKDVDIKRLLVVDPLTFGTAKNRVSLTEDIKNFRTTYNLDSIFSQLTDLMSFEEEKITSYFKNDVCQTAFQKKGKVWTYKYDGNQKENSSCFHVMPYFDMNEDSFWDLGGMFKDVKANFIRTLPSPYFKDYKDKQSFLNENFDDKYLKIINYSINKKEIEANPVLQLDINNISILKTMLDDYKKYPVYMYDFETVKWAIPRYELTNPYIQIPFQYSIDVITNNQYDYNNPSTMKHFDFIGEDQNDPRLKFIHQFIKDMFSNGTGVYVAYNDTFEKSVIARLAFLFPQYRIPLLYIHNHTIDLMFFFKGSKTKAIPWFLVYNSKFKGSYSIKKTQPGLDATFSYKDLNINNGGKASETFRQYQEGMTAVVKLWESTIKPDMIKYCNRDTLAMVVILQQIDKLYRLWEEQTND